jgi:superfamily II DNA or RNA helicase
MKLLEHWKIAEINGDILLKGLSFEEKRNIKRNLTFENPQYEKVMRYSRWKNTRVPQVLTYYNHEGNNLRVPVGYDIDSLDLDLIRDNRVYQKIDTPDFLLKLRDTQKESAKEYIRLNKGSKLYGSVQMPTGKGKSILGLYLASYYSCRTLIVVHKNDLVIGWKEDIELSFGKIDVGIIKAQNKKIGDFITIATVQTLNRLSNEELEKLYGMFSLVIQDEQHHAPSTSFSLVANFRARYKLGLSATPERGDGLTHIINLYYGDFAFRYRDSVKRDEDILTAEVRRVFLNNYYNPVFKKVGNRYLPVEGKCNSNKKYVLKDGEERWSSIDYNLRPKLTFSELDDVATEFAEERVVQDICREYNEGHSCVVFYSKKEGCRYLYDILKSLVGENNVDIYYGDNNSKLNEEILSRAKNKRKHITITTYSKSTEGTNVKQWEVAFFVSSMKSGKNVEQACGRIRRSKKGKIDPVRIYDYRFPYVQILRNHGSERDSRYLKLGFKII